MSVVRVLGHYGMHINLHGEYDFSEEKLQDSFGIKPPKILDFPSQESGERKSANLAEAPSVRKTSVELLVPLER